MHFGLEPYVPYLEYLFFVMGFFLAVFWRPIVGIFYLIPLIPLQTIRYRLNDFPLGQSVVGIMLLGVALGVLRSGKSILPKTPWTKLLCVYVLFTFLSLWVGCFYLGTAWPITGNPRFGVWQDYMVMPALLLLTAAAAPTTRQMKWMLLLMCVATLLLDRSFWNVVAGRDFSTYSEELREGGSMGYAGVNGLSAFEASVTTFLLALAAFEPKFLFRVGYYVLSIFCAVCCIYSLSRGGYLALLVGILFLGLVKQRKLLLVLILFLFTWTSLVPHAVEERVLMSYDQHTQTLDNSSETRLTLWKDAMELFRSNPVMGVGFNTYAYLHKVKRTDGVEGYYEDTHNIFLKVLVETGVLGFLIFVYLLFKTFATGFRLFRKAKDPLLASLGLGLTGWLLCSVVSNCFGDRWTFLQINGYMWMLAGLVSHGFVIERGNLSADSTASESADAGVSEGRTDDITAAWSREGMHARNA